MERAANSRGSGVSEARAGVSGLRGRAANAEPGGGFARGFRGGFGDDPDGAAAPAPDAEDLAREAADTRRQDRAQLIDAVLDDLSAVGSLSDERFVSSFIDGRIRRGKGPMLIRAELRERGGDEGLIDRFLTFSDAFWIEKVRGVREKRFGAAVPGDAGERNRQARFLASRGFPSDLIRRALERA